MCIYVYMYICIYLYVWRQRWLQTGWRPHSKAGWRFPTVLEPHWEYVGIIVGWSWTILANLEPFWRYGTAKSYHGWPAWFITGCICNLQESSLLCMGYSCRLCLGAFFKAKGFSIGSPLTPQSGGENALDECFEKSKFQISSGYAKS